MKKYIKELNISIEYKKLGKDKLLGYFDQRTGEIVINKKGTKAQQDAILIHEFLHVTADCLKQMGVLKKAVDHRFIDNASQQLLACFVLSGKWKGVNKKDLKWDKRHK